MRARSITAALVATFAIACGTFGADTSSTPAGSDGGPPGDGGGVTDGAVEAGPCDPALVGNDPHHCGRCGHDCLGGECSGGVCQPVILAQSPGDAPIFDVALLADRVVWATNDEPESGGPNHGLYFCPKTGCPTPPQNVADGAHNPANIATDGASTAYVSFPGNGLNGVFLATASGFTKIVGHPDAHSMKVVPDGLLLLGLNEPVSPAFSRTVYLWDGTKETARCVFEPPNSANVTMATYAAGFAFLGAVNMSYIASCALATNTVVEFSKPIDSIASITSSASTVFWAGGSDGVLSHCAAAATCASPTDETGLGTFREATIARKDLLLAGRNGDLVRCDPDHCGDSKAIVAHGTTMGTSKPIVGHALAADDTAFYFAAATGPLDPAGNATGWYLAKVAR